MKHFNRRDMLNTAMVAGGAVVLGNLDRLGESVAKAQVSATQPNANGVTPPQGETPLDLPPLPPGIPDRDYMPVVTPNGSTLPFRIVDGVKVMHLVAGEIQHEFAKGLRTTCWGYNGTTPGPTIEAVARDRLRIYVTNRLPTPTTVHWHGIRIVCGMDGVNGLTQPSIPPGETWMYEFTVPDAGTFMYHPHFDEMTQQAMGMMGMFVVHPREREKTPPQRDYAIMLSEWRIDPGASRPVTTEMMEFNILTMNSKVYPATQPLVAQLGEKIRVRFGNLSAMDHHPIHLHGQQMILAETDGGIVPESARYAMNTILVPVGSTRAMDIVAENPGDWAFHCHMTHHVMNQMGHNIPNMVGFDNKGYDQKVRKLLPGYMSMGQTGMGDMTDMGMAVPPNSIPMKGGRGQFAPIDMGGMFTILKIRDRISGYEDPGDYRFPPGTVPAAARCDYLRRDGIDVNADFAASLNQQGQWAQPRQRTVPPPLQLPLPRP
jgi:FtsP/CotA-like multicopper oxidase with cupredoxin domain